MICNGAGEVWWRKLLKMDEIRCDGMVGNFNDWESSNLDKMTFKSLISTPKILTLLSYDGQSRPKC